MLPYNEALAIAHQQLWSRRPPLNWVWRLPVGERVAGGWYFACRLEPLRLIDDGRGARFSGPLGFLVRDDRTVTRVYRSEVGDAEPASADDERRK